MNGNSKKGTEADKKPLVLPACLKEEFKSLKNTTIDYQQRQPDQKVAPLNLFWGLLTTN